MGKLLLARGMGASPGTATGTIVFRSEDAAKLVAEGRSVIFVRVDMTSDDLPGVRACAGVLTTRGGITGDAAIIARSLGKPCIASCQQLRIDYSSESVTVGDQSTDEGVVLKKGDVVTIDGSSGEIWRD